MGQENNRYQAENVAKKIRAICNRLGYETLSAEDFFKGIRERYHKPSLAQVVEEELPLIIQHDPLFFDKYRINLPEKLEVAIFDLYYDRFGGEGVKRVTYSAKVWFRHLRFFSVTHLNEEELDNTVCEFKKILRGDYFETHSSPMELLGLTQH